MALALLASGAGGVLVAPAAHAAPTTAPSASASAAAQSADAIAQAKATGVPVAIPALTTATDTVTADPAGTFTLTSTLLPTRVKQGGSWVPTDATLRTQADGSLTPAATPSGLRLSGGGNTPLATLTSLGKQLAISWPGTLPKPTLSGSSATYPGVLPDVDLVVTATPLGGFTEVLIIKNAAAAANPKLTALQFTTAAQGLTLTAGPDGTLNATDPAGRIAFSAPTPRMWDSSTTAGVPAKTRQGSAADTAPPGASSASGPGTGAQVASMQAQVTENHLNITPNAAVLAGTGTHYPVFIDPSFNPNTVGSANPAFAEVQEGCPTTSNYNSTKYSGDPAVGYNDYQDCIGKEQSYFQFGVNSRIWTTPASPVKILSATLKTLEVSSASTAVTANVKASLYAVSVLPVLADHATWNKRLQSGTLLDTKAVPPATATTQPSTGFNVLAAFTQASTAHANNVVLGLVAANETAAGDRKHFSSTPTVTVTYDSLPTVTAHSTSPATICAGGTSLGTTAVTLSATVNDADQGAPVLAYFSIKRTDGTTVKTDTGITIPQTAAVRGPVTQRGTLSFNLGVLPSGTYSWQVYANDYGYSSPTTSACTFTVDASPPDEPTINSTAFPDPEHGDPANQPQPRTQGDFFFTRAAGNTDVARYAYNWGTQPPTVDPPLTVDANKVSVTTTVPLTPMTPGTNVLYVYAIDTVGNQSPTVHYSFNTAALAAPDAAGDFTGDGKPDLTVPGADGNVRLYPSTGTAPGTLGAPYRATSDATFNGAVLSTGDFDQDLIQDLLARKNDGNLYYYPGNGGGAAFDPAEQVQVQPAATSDTTVFNWSSAEQIVAALDVDGDGNFPDLYVVSGDVLWLFPAASGAGMYNVPVQISTGWSGKTITDAGNINGFPALWSRDTVSGELDLLSTTNVTIPAGSAGGTKRVVAASGWSAAARPQIFSAGDTNGDGKPDLWAADGTARRNITSHLTTGAATTTLGSPRWVQALRPRHDYDGDGRSDMAALYSHPDGAYELYSFKANSNGTFPAPYKSYFAIAGSAWAANMKYATGDYNGDGHGDVAILYGYDDGGVRLFTALGNANGGFDTPVPSWFRNPGSWSFSQMNLQSGDFNGDGRDDLAVWYDYTDGHDTLFTFTATPQGGFNEPFASWTATPGNWELKQAKLAIGDFNGDGRDDLGVFYGYGDMNTVKMHTFLTTPTGAFAYTSTSWTSTVWGSWNQAHIQAGDFNGDGKDDIAAWYDYSDGHDSLNTFISLGTATGTFQAPYSAWSTPAGNYWYDSMPQMVAGDYNGDGRADLGVMYGYGTGTSRMFTWTAKNTGNTADDGHFNDSVASWSSATGWPTGSWANKDVHFFNTHS
ncbi:FG-GAP repeat domain-containing protein [Streptomyces fildesensis]|uniref:FG-GAP repeat domain-containing protein n=1 Tax=Streptomyces fildesensis TaxID=375757 RepID=A0ABW8C9L8_9ACTN